MAGENNSGNARVQARKARQSFYDQDFSTAYKLFVNLFNSHPKAWWLGMEALRTIKYQRRIENTTTIANKYLYFSPDYTTGNSYQKNIYSKHHSYGFIVEPIKKLAFDDLYANSSNLKNTIFHQHWIKEFYWNAPSLQDGILEIDRRIGILKAYKMFGVKIAWTLHNLIDHDASDMQKILCVYTHQKMARISDIIYVHTIESIYRLNEQCGLDLTTKCILLEHPLYDNFLTIDDLYPPKEVDLKKIKGKRLLVCLGMIRPYKGVPNLLSAFSKYTHKSPTHSLYLIVGGRIYDKRVYAELNRLDELARSKILLIDRRLDDPEMGWLIKSADASITPYQNILISGNFYLSTTFKKPTIAPKLGMFPEVIKDGETGFLYDGSIDALADTIEYIAKIDKKNLIKTGEACFNAHKHLTISETSEKFFKTLERLW